MFTNYIYISRVINTTLQIDILYILIFVKYLFVILSM